MSNSFENAPCYCRVLTVGKCGACQQAEVRARMREALASIPQAIPMFDTQAVRARIADLESQLAAARSSVMEAEERAARAIAIAKEAHENGDSADHYNAVRDIAALDAALATTPPEEGPR